MVLWLAMIFIGTFIRGPGWMWFWPGQTWDHARVVFEVNRDLPDLFNITGAWGKGIFGAVVMAIYFGVTGWLVHKVIAAKGFNQKIFKRMSVVQYLTLQFFLLTMLLLPLKMIIRHAFRIKYIWITPWFNI
jgi:hypothetical protein